MSRPIGTTCDDLLAEGREPEYALEIRLIHPGLSNEGRSIKTFDERAFGETKPVEQTPEAPIAHNTARSCRYAATNSAGGGWWGAAANAANIGVRSVTGRLAPAALPACGRQTPEGRAAEPGRGREPAPCFGRLCAKGTKGAPRQRQLLGGHGLL